MRRLVLALATSGVLLWGVADRADASSPPPPPSTPVACKWCSGPPPAPTPVPTLAPTQVLPQPHPVSVEISPTKVRRGGQTRVSVTAEADDQVSMVLKFSHGKPVTYKTAVGRSGKLLKRWKVAKTAPTGKASITVDIVGSATHYTGTLAFTVTK